MIDRENNAIHKGADWVARRLKDLDVQIDEVVAMMASLDSLAELGLYGQDYAKIGWWNYLRLSMCAELWHCDI